MSLRIGNREFAPPAWGVALATLGLAVFVSLGYWQLGRAREKQALSDALEAQGVPAGPINTVDEVFADRAYAPDGGLLPRHLPGAVLADSRSVREQLRGILTRGEVAASDGTRIGLRAGTVCLHGDTAGAEAFIRDIRALLDELQIPVAAP